MLDHKVIINSDGADIEIYDSKPEFSVTAIAKASQSATAHEGWYHRRVERPFQKKSHLEYAYTASARAAQKLLDARHVSGERPQ